MPFIAAKKCKMYVDSSFCLLRVKVKSNKINNP